MTFRYKTHNIVSFSICVSTALLKHTDTAMNLQMLESNLQKIHLLIHKVFVVFMYYWMWDWVSCSQQGHINKKTGSNWSISRWMLELMIIYFISSNINFFNSQNFLVLIILDGWMQTSLVYFVNSLLYIFNFSYRWTDESRWDMKLPHNVFFI